MKVGEFMNRLENVPVGHLEYYPHLKNIALQVIINQAEHMRYRMAVLSRIYDESNAGEAAVTPADVITVSRQLREAIEIGGRK